MATITDHTLVLARIRDDEGREGLGEAAIIPHYGAETQHGICQVISEILVPHLLGQDPTAFGTLLTRMDQLIKRNFYAKAAIEMACVDLAAKAAVASTPAARAESRHPRAETTSIRARPNRSTRQPEVLQLRTKTFRSRMTFN